MVQESCVDGSDGEEGEGDGFVVGCVGSVGDERDDIELRREVVDGDGGGRREGGRGGGRKGG